MDNTLLCMFQRLCTYLQDTGVRIFGGYVLSGHCSRRQISVNNEGYLFSKGYLLTGFYSNIFTNVKSITNRTQSRSYFSEVISYFRGKTVFEIKKKEFETSQKPRRTNRISTSRLITFFFFLKAAEAFMCNFFYLKQCCGGNNNREVDSLPHCLRLS